MSFNETYFIIIVAIIIMFYHVFILEVYDRYGMLE